MKKLILSAVVGLTLVPIFTQADGGLNATYSCTAILIADDLTDGVAEKGFEALSNGASHGGEEIQFYSENHQIILISNGKWMAISWKRDGELLAEAVVARLDSNQSSQTMIVYNPKNVEEQVSLACHLKEN